VILRAVLSFLSVTVLLLSFTAHAQDYTVPYEELLSSYVANGRQEGIEGTMVNYAGWSQDNLHTQAMKEIVKTNPENIHDKQALMAFWINAYNLLTIDLIVKNKERESIKNLGKFFISPWKSYEWQIGEKKYTLDEIEHKILRPMGDSRIHMAVNCASLSCPDLRPEPYTPEKLNSQLDEQVTIFLGNKQKGMTQNGSMAEVSSIFKWFRKDFGNEKGVLAFINSYQLSLTPVKEISNYMDYNWRLNGYWHGENEAAGSP
jgi:hypothetical protein